jgi:hypothetical protein
VGDRRDPLQSKQSIVGVDLPENIPQDFLVLARFQRSLTKIPMLGALVWGQMLPVPLVDFR